MGKTIMGCPQKTVMGDLQGKTTMGPVWANPQSSHRGFSLSKPTVGYPENFLLGIQKGKIATGPTLATFAHRKLMCSAALIRKLSQAPCVRNLLINETTPLILRISVTSGDSKSCRP